MNRRSLLGMLGAGLVLPRIAQQGTPLPWWKQKAYPRFDVDGKDLVLAEDKRNVDAYNKALIDWYRDVKYVEGDHYFVAKDGTYTYFCAETKVNSSSK